MTASLSDDAANALALLAHAHWLQRNADQAAALYTALDLLRPDQPHVLLGLAAAALAQGRAPQALAVLERLALHGRPEAACHLLRAQALVMLDRRAEAGAAMHAVIGLPSPPEPLA